MDKGSRQQNWRFRFADGKDAPAIQAIYAPYVLDSTVTFEEVPPSAQEIAERIAKGAGRFPWIVAEDELGRVQGYAYGSEHRVRRAYRWSVDVTVYVSPEACGNGLGAALYGRLLPILREQNFYRAYGGITLDNEASIRLHEKMGFRRIGVFSRVGYKRGEWHDVGWWELELRPAAGAPGEPQLLERVNAGF